MMRLVFLSRSDGVNLDMYKFSYYNVLFWYRTAFLQTYNGISEYLILANGFRFNMHGYFQPYLFKATFQGDKIIYQQGDVYPGFNFFEKMLAMTDKYDTIIVNPNYYSVIGKATQSLLFDFATTLTMIFKANPQINEEKLFNELILDEAKNKKINAEEYANLVHDTYLAKLYSFYHLVDFAKIYSPKNSRHTSQSGYVRNEVDKIETLTENPFRRVLKQNIDFLREPINSPKVINFFKQYNAKYKHVLSFKEWWQEGENL